MTLATGPADAPLPSPWEGNKANRCEPKTGLEAMARDLASTGFAVFVITRAARGKRLAPSIQSGFALPPDNAVDEIVRHCGHSSKPVWWAGRTDAAPLLNELRWASRLTIPFAETTGMAFPVTAESNQSGAVAFLGDRLTISDRTLADIHARCFRLFKTVVRQPNAARRALPAVSRRELECLKCAADGRTSEEIAEKLRLSVHTANQYLASVAQKLNANGRMHAVAKALRAGLIE